MGFFVILFISFFLNNPLDRSSTSYSYPYILSVKPNLVENGMNANISLLSTYGRLENHNISILVINPDGTPVHPQKEKDIRKRGNLQFPTDFRDHLGSLNGNYT